jgi:aminoglycoside 6-adenylyltransferase
MTSKINDSGRQADTVSRLYEQLIARFIDWARGQEAIRAVIQVGSRTRQDHPADEWADADLMLYLTAVDTYMQRTDWLERIAPVWMSISSRTAGGDPELLVMFEGGYNIDFVFCSIQALEWLHNHAQLDPLFQRGARVLLDRDGLAPHIEPRVQVRQPPSQDDFYLVCNSFWYASIYVARQIRRGDLWLAKMRDSQQKEFLLRMVEWQTGVRSQWQRDTWHMGRFIDQWADERALKEFNRIYGGYDAASASRAMWASVALFHWLAQETATGLGYAYPIQTQERAAKLIRQAIGDP